MAKRIKNPVTVSIQLKTGTTTTGIDYGVECDDGLEMRKGFTPTLTPAEQALINQIIARAVVLAQQHEGL